MIPLFKVYMNPEVDKSLLDTLHSGWIGQGNKVIDFERELSRRVENPYCLSLSAGTHGIHLALKLAGVKYNSDVICTPLTCTASNWPVLYQEANIIWADIKEDDLNIDPESIEDEINSDREGKNIKAVIVVHWGGYPCDMKRIHEICRKRKIVVIEDAAHAFGSSYIEDFKIYKIGECCHSDFTMFSFQAIKILNSVDGGALFCKEEEDYKRGKLLRWYGIDREGPRQDLRCESNIEEYGYKYHMNDVCATIGLSNLEKVKQNLMITKDNAIYYNQHLKNTPGVVLTQQGTEKKKSSYWLYTIYVEDRTGFARRMGEKGIMVSRVHERNDKHSCVSNFKKELPVLEKVVKKMICLPVGWWLTEEEREYIVNSIKEGW